MKKLLVLLSIMLMLLPLGSLAEDAADVHLRLIEAANTLTDRMLAVCGDEHYVQIFTSAAQLTDEIKAALAFDYTQPACHVLLTLPPNGVSQFWQITCGEEPSDAVRDVLTQKLALGLVNIINSRQGTTWLAASSMMTVSDVALLPEVPQGSYLLFTVFGEEAPMLCTSVLVKADGLASMSATLVKPDEAQRTALLDETVTNMTCLTSEGADSMAEIFFDGLIHEVYPAEK